MYIFFIGTMAYIVMISEIGLKSIVVNDAVYFSFRTSLLFVVIILRYTIDIIIYYINVLFILLLLPFNFFFVGGLIDPN